MNLEAKIIKNIKRPSKELIREIGCFPTTIISDCLNRCNVMHSGIKGLIAGARIAAPAVTVEEIEGGNLMSHFAIYVAKAGDVLVVDGKGCKTRSGWGGLQTRASFRREISGLVIDGAVRDSEDIKELGFPVFCRAVTPAGPHKGWGGSINVPISCGGVTVNPGDVIVADSDGVAVVPQELLKKVIGDCKDRKRKEKDWFKRVDAGERTIDFLGFTKKIQGL